MVSSGWLTSPGGAGDLIREALDGYLAERQPKDWKEALEAVRGVWADREDSRFRQKSQAGWGVTPGAAVRPVSAYLLDTCVMIDYLRNWREAIEFMHRQETRPAVSAITAAELFAGVRSSAEEHGIEALCRRLLIYHVDLKIARLGGTIAANTGIAMACRSQTR